MSHLSGSISVARELDREEVEVYHLIVQANDGGNKVGAVIFPLTLSFIQTVIINTNSKLIAS